MPLLLVPPEVPPPSTLPSATTAATGAAATGAAAACAFSVVKSDAGIGVVSSPPGLCGSTDSANDDAEGPNVMVSTSELWMRCLFEATTQAPPNGVADTPLCGAAMGCAQMYGSMACWRWRSRSFFRSLMLILIAP